MISVNRLLYTGHAGIKKKILNPDFVTVTRVSIQLVFSIGQSHPPRSHGHHSHGKQEGEADVASLIGPGGDDQRTKSDKFNEDDCEGTPGQTACAQSLRDVDADAVHLVYDGEQAVRPRVPLGRG